MTVPGPAKRIQDRIPCPPGTRRAGISLAPGADAAYSHAVRTSPAHRLLAALMALWLPFCCCQARAAARTVAHAMHAGGEAVACVDDVPACCRAEIAPDADCCGNGERGADDADTSSAPAPCDDCAACGSLKAKAAAPAVPGVEHDSVGVPDAALSAVPASDEAVATGARASWPRAHAPPWKPGGRSALALHARLVI